MTIGSKIKDHQTIRIIGDLVDLLLGKTLIGKYSDLAILVVKAYINHVYFRNTLIDLGFIIYIMKKQTMEVL